jgi:hypothetical protein
MAERRRETRVLIFGHDTLLSRQSCRRHPTWPACARSAQGPEPVSARIWVIAGSPFRVSEEQINARKLPSEWNVQRVHERESLLKVMSLRGVRQVTMGTVKPTVGSLPLIWRLLGAQPLDCECLYLPRAEFSDDEVADIRSHFPDAWISVSFERPLPIPKALLIPELVPPPPKQPIGEPLTLPGHSGARG